MKNDFLDLKSWVHWKRLEKDLPEDDVLFVKEIADLLSMVGTLKAELARVKSDYQGSMNCCEQLAEQAKLFTQLSHEHSQLKAYKVAALSELLQFKAQFERESVKHMDTKMALSTTQSQLAEVQTKRAYLADQNEGLRYDLKEARAKLVVAVKALERYANRPEGMIEVDRYGNPQECLTSVARESLAKIELSGNSGQLPDTSMRKVLAETQAYLHWRGDDLCGDDLVGDGRLTKSYKAILLKVETALTEKNCALPLTHTGPCATDTSMLNARAGGLDKAAEICRYHASLPMRNDAGIAMARDIETSCLATAGRIRRGEYENPTSAVMQSEKVSARIECEGQRNGNEEYKAGDTRKVSAAKDSARNYQQCPECGRRSVDDGQCLAAECKYTGSDTGDGK